MAIRRASDLSSGDSPRRPERHQRRNEEPRTKSPQPGQGATPDGSSAPSSGRKRIRKDLSALPREEQVEAAKTVALNSLAMMARTRGELETKLKERLLPDDVIAEALDRLTEVGLIDDAAYARMFASSRHEVRGLSAYAIRMQLRRKGLADELIEDALADMDGDSERERAVDLVRRKAPSTKALDNQARTRRLASMLARKGYSSAVAFSVVKEVLGDLAAEMPED